MTYLMFLINIIYILNNHVDQITKIGGIESKYNRLFFCMLIIIKLYVCFYI